MKNPTMQQLTDDYSLKDALVIRKLYNLLILVSVFSMCNFALFVLLVLSFFLTATTEIFYSLLTSF